MPDNLLAMFNFGLTGDVSVYGVESAQDVQVSPIQTVRLAKLVIRPTAIMADVLLGQHRSPAVLEITTIVQFSKGLSSRSADELSDATIVA